jgi:hypothetical protein
MYFLSRHRQQFQVKSIWAMEWLADQVLERIRKGMTAVAMSRRCANRCVVFISLLKFGSQKFA